MNINLRQLIKVFATSDNRKAEGIRFIITGSIATLIQYGCYLLFLMACGVSPVTSTITSYTISFIVNYFLSNKFTFRTQPKRKNALSFFCCHIINLGLQTAFVAIFSRLFNPEYALIPAMAICIPCNFLLVRFALKSKRFS